MKGTLFFISQLCALSLLCACRPSSVANKDEDKTVSDTIFRLDMSYLNSLNQKDPAQVKTIWDDLHTIATLQGVVNRDKPSLYINYVTLNGKDIDQYWWDKYSAAGEWLSGRTTKKLGSVIEAVKKYETIINGVVLYDTNVPSTSDIASAVAGADNLIAVRYDTSEGSLYSKIVSGGLKLPVKVWLVNKDGSSLFTGSGVIPGTSRNSTGSIKCDPYYWLIANYIEKGKCDTRWGGYYIDQYWRSCPTRAQSNHHCLTNHDFFVSKKAFFLDLSPWGDEPATDDKGQASVTDLQTLKDLLMAAYKNRGADEMCYIGGFPSWAHKYTFHDNGKHQDVETEWEYSQIISQYNAFMDADAIGYGALANASFWQHFPLNESYPQKSVTKEDLKSKGLVDDSGNAVTEKRDYYIFYVGDYDASSWIYQEAPFLWDDPDRGSVPLMWAVSPVLSERSPQVMHYFRTTASDNDYFVAADNGAGYLNPGELRTPRTSGLPSGIDAWKNHCKKYYDKWGISITGFIIDGNSRQMNSPTLDAYSEFSPDGIVPQKTGNVLSLHNGMPVLRSGIDLNASSAPADAAAAIIARIDEERKDNGQPFHWFRVVLASPSWYKQVSEEVSKQRSDIVLLDAPSFFSLMRIYKEL